MVEELKEETVEKSEDDIRMDIDAIEQKEPAKAIDVSLYEGKRATLKKPEMKEVIDWYSGPVDAKGNPTYNPESTAKKMVIEITSEPIDEVDEDGNPTGNKLMVGDNPVTVSHRFNLRKEIKEDGSINWVISKHPKASLWKFMKKMGVEKLSELEGKRPTLTYEPSKDPEDERSYLRIVV